MQMTPESDENSGQTEQNLPVSGGTADSARAVQPSRKALSEVADRTLGPGAGEAAATLSGRPVQHDFLIATGPSARCATPEQAVGRAIESAVTGLHAVNAASLAVVLKPDGNTQLSLHLKLQGGRFEALAVLDRGDYKAINSEWAQLQSRLAEQGIRLAPLVCNATRTSGFAGGHFSSSERRRDDSAAVDVPGSDLAPSHARKSGAPTVHSTTGREWWA